MEGMKLSRVLAGGTALLFLIGGGAIEATATHGAVASVSNETTTTTTSTGLAGSTSTGSAGTYSEVLGKRKHHKKRHHKRKHHRKHHGKKHHKQNHQRATGMSVYAGTTGRWGGAVDTGSLSAVNAAYTRYYASGTNVPTGYASNDSQCEVGGNTTASLAATRNAVNFVRSLGGLAPVSFNGTLNARSQRTAVMMSANRSLSHEPPSSWRCYTGDGAQNAGKSNLALSYPSITSAGVVGLYMQDPGSSNSAVGHRRWLMNPFSTEMGSGSTNTANSITVIGPRSSARPNPAFVGWPSAGYFPDSLEPTGRWSLSAGNSKVSFAGASVSVYRNGTRLAASKARVENGYAQPTLVFNVPASQARSGVYTVNVSGIKTTGAGTTSYSYKVRMFTPSS